VNIVIALLIVWTCTCSNGLPCRQTRYPNGSISLTCARYLPVVWR
jgi:hypothetical protein